VVRERDALAVARVHVAIERVAAEVGRAVREPVVRDAPVLAARRERARRHVEPRDTYGAVNQELVSSPNRSK
jgi:hypothetical protein